jgi:hypothetical protein
VGVLVGSGVLVGNGELVGTGVNVLVAWAVLVNAMAVWMAASGEAHPKRSRESRAIAGINFLVMIFLLGKSGVEKMA